MLTLTLALIAPSHTVEATIPGWSTASFRVHVNGAEVAHLTQKSTLDLDRHLRPGENRVEVRYSTNDGKISRLSPAILRLERRDGDKKSTPIRIVASEDNPRGKVATTLVIPRR